MASYVIHVVLGLAIFPIPLLEDYYLDVLKGVPLKGATIEFLSFISFQIFVAVICLILVFVRQALWIIRCWPYAKIDYYLLLIAAVAALFCVSIFGALSPEIYTEGGPRLRGLPIWLTAFFITMTSGVTVGFIGLLLFDPKNANENHKLYRAKKRGV